MARNERFTVEELHEMPTLHQGHFGNLKFDDGKVRYWLSRMTKADGEKFPVQVERLQNGNWVTVHEYGQFPDE